MNRKTLLRTIVGLAISGVAIWILARSVDVPRTVDVLRTANPLWILVMVGTCLLDVGARGARWQALLASIKRLPYRRVLGYTYLGYLANNVLPARLGELVRSHALGEGEGISRPTVLGTVVVERIVDTVIVVGLAALAVLALGVAGAMSTAVVLGAVFVGVLVVGLFVAMISHRLPGAERVTAAAERYPRVLELARRLRDGLAVASRPSTLVRALVFSAAAWAASFGTFMAGGQAVGIELSITQAALLSCGVALATIVPSAPGYVGTFELTAVSIAKIFNADPDAAFAMALLVHAMILGVTSAGGVVAALRLGVGLDTGADAGAAATAAPADPATRSDPVG
ncbi:MAG TPA: lysylphosphatidylglycerol synthase transmembrane domain-containing protein [Methylomirabilota bacterium]|nr:lysylphosphatidylglycerol synthase transmembrane domain-containing protein [Methylomirabilota bacterium]